MCPRPPLISYRQKLEHQFKQCKRCLCRAMQILEKTAAATEGLRDGGSDLERWFVPKGYIIQN